MIVVVEDSATSAKDTKIRVGNALPSYHIVAVRDRTGMAQVVHHNKVQLVICDIMLPDIEWKPLLRSMQFLEAPVIMYTGSDNPKIWELCEELGLTIVSKGNPDDMVKEATSILSKETSS